MNIPIRASGVLIVSDGSILGVSRKDDHSAFGLPAGGREADENTADTAARELKEETSLVVEPSSMVALLDAIEPNSGCRVVTFWAPTPENAQPKSSEAGVIAWVGWKALTGPTAPYAEYNTWVRQAYIDKIPEGWVEAYGSGSLRRAREENLRWKDMYLEERAAFEFGYGFQPVLKSRIAFGDALAESDSPATTETCWWARRLRRLNPDAEVRVLHAHLTEDSTREGIGILITPKQTPHWLPKDRVLFAFTVDATGRTVNPC